MTWRTEQDPIEQVAMLGVLEEILALNWDRKRVDAFLDTCKDADDAIKRIKKADKRRDQPRLMHKDAARPPTASPYLAAAGEPELVPKAYEDDLARENRAKDHTYRMERHKARKDLPIEERLHLALRQSEKQGVPVKTQLGAIERQVERIEKRLDRV